MSAELELKGLTKSFGAHRAVDGLSLRVAPGELISLLGPSGCGKTTVLRMIAGLERTDAGEIFLDGRQVAGNGVHVPPEQRALGMVFQSYAVFPHRSVAENVAYPLKVRGTPRSELPTRVAKALAAVQLGALGDRRPHELSGGQLQRVALARALVAEPKVLLLDEPMSNLDAALRDELRAELAALRARAGITTVLVTHDQTEALSISDRVAVMQGGRLEQVGAPDALYAAPCSPFVAGFVGANLLRGESRSNVLTLEDGKTAVRLPAPAPDGPLVFAAHPEHLELRPDGTSLLVVARLFRGGSIELRLASDTAGPVILRLQTSSQAGARVGDRVGVVVRSGVAFPGSG